MTGRERIEAAFSAKGTSQIPAVLCYEGIYIRDHWQELTSAPWWHQWSPNLEEQLAWRGEAIERTGQDWFALPRWYSQEERRALSLAVCEGGVFLLNRRTGSMAKLEEPHIGGWNPEGELESYRAECLPRTPEEVAAAIPDPFPSSEAILHDGRGDLARALVAEFGERLFPIASVGAPLWRCYRLWGFEEMMVMIATAPDLVRVACERYLAGALHSIEEAALLGAAGIWIEDCMTDMISPASARVLNLPYLQRIVEAIRALGMKSIYYYCGNPADRWEEILAIGADAISLEESKKGFQIDIEEVVGKVQGRAVVLGNLDAIELLPQASEGALRQEISRQIAAGRRNGGRFIMSIGSPVTPGTPVARVRRYCDLVRELGRA